jgi:hypothetical protein
MAFHIAMTLLAGVLFPFAAGEANPPMRILDATAESTRKDEVRHSMMGPRDTLLFYTFPDHQAILMVNVNNQTKRFSINATVYMFASGVGVKGLAKWVNNQHSDALFPEAPEPVGVYPLPGEAFSVISHELVNQTNEFNGTYENHLVTFAMRNVTEKGVFELKPFAGETTVHVRIH